MSSTVHIGVPTVIEAADLQVFFRRLGVETDRTDDGLDIEADEPEVATALAAWLHESRSRLVPDGFVLRPPAG
jgi:hypothetical protein